MPLWLLSSEAWSKSCSASSTCMNLWLDSLLKSTHFHHLYSDFALRLHMNLDLFEVVQEVDFKALEFLRSTRSPLAL